MRLDDYLGPKLEEMKLDDVIKLVQREECIRKFNLLEYLSRKGTK